MNLSENMTELEMSRFMGQQAFEALQALARGEARILRDEDGNPVGVAWPYEDCEEEIHWTN